MSSQASFENDADRRDGVPLRRKGKAFEEDMRRRLRAQPGLSVYAFKAKRGIEERVKELRGVMTIRGEAWRGTAIAIRLPMSARAEVQLARAAS